MSTMTPIEKLRHQCLQRGAHGIKAFARQFRAMDHTGDKKLDKQEFKKGLLDFKVDLSDHEVDTLFKELDKDGNDNISFNEFLVALRPDRGGASVFPPPPPPSPMRSASLAVGVVSPGNRKPPSPSITIGHQAGVF
ncbi:hypothetical protein HPB49_012775 [Dermacentor silvarum]|uniref:Uncharacterized protein n=1 Tax=Dermacentor silvarum TaxID=543639 RepID=A0ACB8DJ96_DERSI|nr:hypothetical protein HPB49_012775 [Dermacentor silvarum]